MSWLDLKLGVRMLAKYPGLTLVGGSAMTFAIWAGVVIFQVVTLFVYPTLPLPNGDRLVQIRTIDVNQDVEEDHVLRDFLVWREGVRSIADLGAWRDSTRNLIVAPGDAAPVQVAEMSASGFRVAHGEPLLGRVLVAADDAPAAPHVAVIGYDVWRTRLASDPNVLGRTVEVGDDDVKIVGVMREGFAFPVSHEVWLPLRTSLLGAAPGFGPALTVFGVLAPGETLTSAQAELKTFGQRAALEMPATHAHLEPRVSLYARMFAADGSSGLAIMSSIYFFVLLILVLIFGNVGLLVFARAAARESDLLVRIALGASRRRLIAQMFAEALVLGALAAVVALGAADLMFRRWGRVFFEADVGRTPFWFHLGVSGETVALAAIFTLLAAAVAGVMPALKITRGMHDRLKQTTAGSGGLRFGGIWSVVIVAQVAVTVAFPGLVYWEQYQLRHIRDFDPGFAAAEYLTVPFGRDVPADSREISVEARHDLDVRFANAIQEVRRRVTAQPDVSGVTFAARLPATGHPQRLIELGSDASAAAANANGATPLREATIAEIDASYFDTLGAPLLAGRAFTTADLAPGARVAIVDQGFVDQVLQGRSPIGQQVRFVNNGNEAPSTPNPWYEIVGVVRDLGVGAPTRRGRAAGFYIPSTPDRFDQVYMLVHARGGDPTKLAPRIRDIVTAVDPQVQLGDFRRASDVNEGILWTIGMWLQLTLVMSTVAIVLSLAGIYAVLSFAVTRRTREIGLRVALGATPARVVASIFRRPLVHVGLGVFAGTSIIFTVATLAKHTEFPGSEGGLSAAAMAMLIAHATVMLGICLLSCVVPARRALGVQPTVALRAD